MAKATTTVIKTAMEPDMAMTIATATKTTTEI
jgi:hypothetical protein